jgi:hypothetical protein
LVKFSQLGRPDAAQTMQHVPVPMRSSFLGYPMEIPWISQGYFWLNLVGYLLGSLGHKYPRIYQHLLGISRI